MHEVHARRELRQVQRLFEGRVASSDDVDVLLAEERRVTGCARRDSAPLVLLLGLDPEPACAGAGGDDHCAGLELVASDPHPKRLLGEVDLRDVIGDELGTEPLGLAAKVSHHLRPHHAVGVAGVVLDVARDHQLAAPLEPLDHERSQVGARGVERSRIAGGAATDDDQVTDVLVAQGAPS